MIAKWIFRVLLRLFPADFRAEHGQDAAETFAELRQRSRGRDRLWLTVRTFVRMPAAAFAERLNPAPRSPHTTPGDRFMSGWITQLRQAARTLLKTPSFTGSAVLLVGLGVGAVTTIFTLIDHLVFRPLPYPAAERLVTPTQGSHTGPQYEGMQELPGFEAWSAGFSYAVNLVGQGAPQRLQEAQVDEGFFDIFGAAPVRGRLLEPDDYSAGTAVVLSEALWRRAFGGAPDVLGQTVTVDGEPRVVVGVLDAGFEPPEPLVGRTVDLWRPLDESDEGLASHEYRRLNVVGRMQEGVTVADAQAAMDGLSQSMAPVHENHRDRDGNWEQLPVVPLRELTSDQFRAGLGMLLGAVGLLLAVACLNVAHLFLARGIDRRREMAIRRSLGAGTRALVRQLMAESVVVAALGGVLGIGLGVLGLRAFLTLSPYALPRDVPVGLDLRIVAFVAGLSLLTSVAFGLFPALQSIRQDPGEALKQGSTTSTAGRGSNRVRSSLLVAEVAFSLVLVSSAGLLMHSFLIAQGQEAGFDADQVWTIPLTTGEIDTPEQWVSEMEEIRLALELNPAVELATYGLTMPIEETGGSRCCWRSTVTTEDESAEASPWLHPVTADYFDVLSIPLLFGGVWSEAEAAGNPAPIVVSESLAREFFSSSQAALNQIIGRLDDAFRIVGVAGDVRHYGLDAAPEPTIYLPVNHVPFAIPQAHMAVRLRERSSGSPQAILRDAVWQAAPNLPVPIVRPMSEWLELGSAGRRFDAVLFMTFGGIALLLAAGGITGTLLYVTGQRRRELAIRMALGATRGAIERWVLRGGLTLAALGIVLGLGGSWLATRLIENRLFGVDRGDPTAMIGSAAILLVTAVLACWIPAKRAGRTNPLQMLNTE